jgi:glutaredoxin
VKAQAWLDARGYRYELLDVEADRAPMDEMVRRSGQRRCPTLVVGEHVLPDFGPDELPGFLQKHGLAPP